MENDPTDKISSYINELIEMTGENPPQKKYRGNDLHIGKTVRVTAGGDDLSQHIRCKVITGKNITT